MLRRVIASVVAASTFRRLPAIHANHKRIATSALLIGILTIIAKLFVAGREVAIAWRFGVSGTVDAYQLAITIVTWVPMLLTGAISAVFVPRLVSLHRQPESRVKFLGEFNGTIIFAGATVGIGTILMAGPAAELLASRLEPDALRLTTSLARHMAPVAFAITVAGYLTARLQSKESFAYTITEAVPAFLIALLIVGPIGLSGASPLIFGTLIGYACQVIVLGLLVVRADPPLGAVRFAHNSNEWATIYVSALLMTLAQLLITAANPIDQAFAARVGVGAVAMLGYASRILVLVTGLATAVIGRALLPVLSEAVAKGEFKLGRDQTLQWSAIMFVLAVPGSLLLWATTPELVKLLFQRGAFDARATAAVSDAVRYGLWQLPFYFAGIVLVQWYAANERFREILVITGSALVVKTAANFLLAPTLGVNGIMLSTVAMYALTCLLMILMLNRAGSNREASHGGEMSGQGE